MTVFFDTETTGLSEPRLVELAWSIDGGPIQSLRCKPPKDIELDATVVNGIRTKDVAMLQAFYDMPAYAEIKELFENSIVVAHNVAFDAQVLRNEGINVTTMICTKEMAQAIYPDAPKHRLQHLRYWLDLEVDNLAHSAAGDTQTLMALWDAMVPEGMEEVTIAQWRKSCL